MRTARTPVASSPDEGAQSDSGEAESQDKLAALPTGIVASYLPDQISQAPVLLGCSNNIVASRW